MLREQMQDFVEPPNIFQSKWSAIKCLSEYTALMLARPSLVTNIPSVFWSISFCIYCYILGATTLGDRHHRKLLTFTTGESICRAERGWSSVVQREERREAVVAAVLIFAQMWENVPQCHMSLIVGSPSLSEATLPNVAIGARRDPILMRPKMKGSCSVLITGHFSGLANF